MWSDYYYGYHKQLASGLISLEGSIKTCTGNSQGEWGLHVLFYQRVWGTIFRGSKIVIYDRSN